MTQEEIAKKHNVHQTQIQRILSGKRSASGFTVQTIDNMFPNAVIYLDGSVIADNSGTVNGMIGINNGTVNADGETFRSRAIDALLESDLPPEYALRSIKIIKNL
jgi:hypothetical protein